VSLLQNIVIILILIAGAGFLSLTEIALAGARKVKLKILAESGEHRAQKVLDLQENSADFFAASQIGLNAVAILGGILGEGAFRPYIFNFVSRFYQGPYFFIYFICRFNAEASGHDCARKDRSLSHRANSDFH